MTSSLCANISTLTCNVVIAMPIKADQKPNQAVLQESHLTKDVWSYSDSSLFIFHFKMELAISPQFWWGSSLYDIYFVLEH